MTHDLHAPGGRLWGALLLALALCGCGKTLTRAATEQLLTSDAVDRAVARLDFSDLAGRKVFFDTQYVQHIKGHGFVNSEYIISSMRQQMTAADVLLQEKREEADYVVEVRVGALGTDGNEVVYGIPANNMFSVATNVVPGAPPLPTIPELALAKRNDQLGAAKIAAFAYNRNTKHPVWQSGISEARSTSRDNWYFGAGPFQSGTIHNGPRFAGEKIELALAKKKSEDELPLIGYHKEHHFIEMDDEPEPAAVAEAKPSAEETAKPADDKPVQDETKPQQATKPPEAENAVAQATEAAPLPSAEGAVEPDDQTAGVGVAGAEPAILPDEGWRPPRKSVVAAGWSAGVGSIPADAGPLVLMGFDDWLGPADFALSGDLRLFWTE